MKILHFTRSRFANAAGRAAALLDETLRAAGLDSRLVSADDCGQEPPSLTGSEAVPVAGTTFDVIQRFELDDNRAHPFASRFVLGYPGVNLGAQEVPDIFHLHDVKGFLAPSAIAHLLQTGRPVFWTLDDAWPFTGGCLHPVDCTGFADTCRHCPQLSDDRCNLPSALCTDKHAWFRTGHLILLASAQWLAEAASRSPVFAGRRIELLQPAPVPIRPDRAAARRLLEIDADAVTLLFFCENTACADISRERLTRLLTDAALFGPVKRLVREQRLQAVALGLAGSPFRAAEVPVFPICNTHGRLRSPLALAAADLGIATAPEEASPALLAEACAHELPVLGFAAAGLPDIPRGEPAAEPVAPWQVRRFAERLALLLAQPAALEKWRAACGAVAASAQPGIAARCIEFYRSLGPAASQSPPATAIAIGLAPPAEDALRPALRTSCWNVLNRTFTSWPAAFADTLATARSVADKMKSLVAATDDKLALLERKLARTARHSKGGSTNEIAPLVVTVKKLRRRLEVGLGRHLRFTWDAVQNGATPDLLRCNAAQHHFYPHDLRTRLRDRLVRGLARLLLPAAPEMDALFQYPPRPLIPERFPKPRCKDRHLPTIAIVTPSFMQGNYLERTMRSVLDQNYPHLRYAVQDAGSTDATPDILRRYAPRLASWTSAPDTGQARAILTGFQKIQGDIMAWLNSDDLLMPGTLRFVGEFFSRHPHVDALYGHRVIIDEEDREVGRWVLPRFDARTLRWIDYVPQETLFWRAALWEKTGGIDPKFRFAMDWDLLLRFVQAGARIVRVPYFLGCFRVHARQKTSADIGTVGAEEIAYLRWRENGGEDHDAEIGHVRKLEQSRSALCRWLLERGIRW